MKAARGGGKAYISDYRIILRLSCILSGYSKIKELDLNLCAKFLKQVKLLFLMPEEILFSETVYELILP
ncbi:MAG: hypothetical protein ACQESP_12990 [Candidatus Muiribacteriota bacterium]